MKKLIFIYCLITCSVHAESFLARVWQIKDEQQIEFHKLTPTNSVVVKPQERTAYLNKSVQIPLIFKNEIKGSITFKEGRELKIVKETQMTFLVTIGNFACDIKKSDIRFN